MTLENDPREWSTSLADQNNPRVPRDPHDLAHSPMKEFSNLFGVLVSSIRNSKTIKITIT